MSDKKVAIGIDLGTTKCCVGAVRNGKVEILENHHGNKTTPSYVAFTGIKRLVGEDARNQAALNSANTVYAIKSIKLKHPILQRADKDLPYTLCSRDGETFISVTYKKQREELLPQQMTAMLLTKMKQLAEDRLGCSVEDAVISVPASFNIAQRQATKDAATIAGLKVLALVNEPTAAAIAYQTNRKGQDEENIAVVDFGGGKLDVAIVSVSGAHVFVKGLYGTTEVSGDYATAMLMKHFLGEFNHKFCLPDHPHSKTVLDRLRSSCERIKRILSLLPKVNDQLDCFGEDFILPIEVNRLAFEDMISSKIHSSLDECFERALKTAGIAREQIKRILLVGGSTRIPCVLLKLESLLKKSNGLDRSVNPDEAVAQGAAIYAGLLSGDNNIPHLVVNDTIPYSVCLDPSVGKKPERPYKASKRTIPSSKKFQINCPSARINIYEKFPGPPSQYSLIGEMQLSKEFGRAASLITGVNFGIDRCGIYTTSVQLVPGDDSKFTFMDVTKDLTGRLTTRSLTKATRREKIFRQDEADDKDRILAINELESCCFNLLSEINSICEKAPFKDLVEPFMKKINDTIDWLDAAELVPKADCFERIQFIKKLEKDFREEMEKVEAENH